MKKLLLLILISWIGLAKTYSQVELVPNGTFENPLTYEDGYGYYSGSSTAYLLDNMRVDSVAFEGTHSVRIFDHTWGTFFWNYLPGYSDNNEYTVTFWYKGAEPIKFSMFIGRDLEYDLGADPENIVPGNAVVMNSNADSNAKIVWTLDSKPAWTKFSYTFRMSDWLGNDPVTGEPKIDTCLFMFENTSYAMDDGPTTYIDKMSIQKRNLNELVLNGGFESPLTYDDGFGFYAGSSNVPLLDDMRVDSVAFEGSHSVRIFDHTWGTFLWDLIKGFTDSTSFDVSFWYKGAEPMNFSMFIGRDLHYNLVADPDNIVPENATVFDEQGVIGTGIRWYLNSSQEWTHFTYSFNISNWIGNDSITGEPGIGECTIMFGNTSFMMNDGPSSYIDNVSIVKGISTLGLGEYEQVKKIGIFPNPSSNFINLNGISTGTNLLLFNMEGQAVKQVPFIGQPINISDLSKGFYCIKGTDTQGNLFLGRFIKN